MDVPLAGAEYTSQAVEVLIEKSDAPHRSINAQNAPHFGQMDARDVGVWGFQLMRIRDLSPEPPIAHLTPFKRNGAVIGYVADLGLGGDGRRRRRVFTDRDQAEQFLNEHTRTTFDPLHGRRNEVMFSLE